MANSAFEFPTENFVIGGNFDTNPWQTNTTFTAPTGTATRLADCWYNAQVGAARATYSQYTGVNSAPSVAQCGMFVRSSLDMNTTTIATPIGPGDYNYIGTRLEGYNWAQFAQAPFILSFWVFATNPGVYCVSFTSSAQDQTFVSQYTVNNANTWEYKTINVTASPAAGTWNYTNGTGIDIRFAIVAGANFNIAANNQWQAFNYLSTNAQVNGMQNVGDRFRIALVQCKSGTQSSAFERRSIKDELALCQRYIWKSFAQGTVPADNIGYDTGELVFPAIAAGAVNQRSQTFLFPVQMRGTPTGFTIYNPAPIGAGVGAANTIVDRDINLDCGASFALNTQAGTGFMISVAGNAGTGTNDRLSFHALVSAGL